MKYFPIFTIIIMLTLLTLTPALAENISDLNTSNPTSQEIIKIEDSSGLSDDEVRHIAKESDKAESEAIIEDRTSSDKATWGNLSPTAAKYDWIELTSGEWLKGEFKTMYDKELEFDSKELDLVTLDFEDIKQIRTHRIVTVSILIEDEHHDSLFGLRKTTIEAIGILRLNNKKVTIIRGDGKLEFERNQIISIAYGGENEREYWSGKVTLGLDAQQGNTDKLNFTTIAKIQRRTSKTRLQLDYISNIFTVSGQETANNHRINESFDVFVTKQFYYTPIFSEYLRDKYQNINNQYTVGIGIGYTLIDTKKTNWDISGGPALVYTKYDTVVEGNDISITTGALELSTAYDIEVTKRIDFIFNYKLTFTQTNAGRFKHHMVTAFENELTSWLDIDLTLIWDYTQIPEPNEDQTIPEQSDLQLLVSFGIDF